MNFDLRSWATVFCSETKDRAWACTIIGTREQPVRRTYIPLTWNKETKRYTEGTPYEEEELEVVPTCSPPEPVDPAELKQCVATTSPREPMCLHSIDPELQDSRSTLDENFRDYIPLVDDFRDQAHIITPDAARPGQKQVICQRGFRVLFGYLYS